jgi:hypothetical protein
MFLVHMRVFAKWKDGMVKNLGECLNVCLTTGISVPGLRTGAEIPSSQPFLEVHWPPVNPWSRKKI